jgi:hypothetical protein
MAGAGGSIESGSDYGITLNGSRRVRFVDANHPQPGASSDLAIEPTLNDKIGQDRSLGHVVLNHAQIQSLFAI